MLGDIKAAGGNNTGNSQKPWQKPIVHTHLELCTVLVTVSQRRYSRNGNTDEETEKTGTVQFKEEMSKLEHGKSTQNN